MWLMTSVCDDIVVTSAYHSLIQHRENIMTGAVCEADIPTPSGAPDFTSGFHRSSCCPVICVSLFHVILSSFGF